MDGNARNRLGQNLCAIAYAVRQFMANVLNKAVIMVLLLACGGTVVLGLGGVIGPAFGYLPAIGANNISLDGWVRFWSAPGIIGSILLSLSTGLAATLLALIVSQVLLALSYGRSRARSNEAMARILLAAPHVSLALALVFLLTPSGVMMRLAALFTGADLPLDYLFPGDGFGGALIFGLAIKEAAFLYVVGAVAAREVRPSPILAQTASLGYGQLRGWMIGVFPAIYIRIRMPAFIALAFATSSVEQALILGPSSPAALPVRLLAWFTNPDLAMRLPLATGSLVLAALVALAILIWICAERLAANAGRTLAMSGTRSGVMELLARAIGIFGPLIFMFALAGLLVLSLSSFTNGWVFPNIIPQSWDMSVWNRASNDIGAALANTLWLALACSFFATVAALAGLEATRDYAHWRGALTLLLFLPLLVPEATLVFGLNVTWSALYLDGTFGTLLWAHLVFALPYAWLMLEGPYRAIDPRLVANARVLGLGPFAVFRRVTLPMLLAPICTAIAVSALISLSLYLTTLVAGGGRYPTLITESIALSASGDRRVLGAMTLILLMLPLICLDLAQRIPRIVYYNRTAMTGDL